jgi:hypothetical protein
VSSSITSNSKYVITPQALGIVADDIQKNSSVNTTTKALTSSFLTYENLTYGIKIRYPADWEKKEPTLNQVVFRFPPQENASGASSKYLLIIVSTFDPQENMTLDKLTREQIDFLKESFPDLSLNESESYATTLSGNPAYKVTFDHRNEEQQGSNPDYKLIQIWTIKGDKVYYLTYRAELGRYSDNYLQTIQKMIDSFVVSDFLLYENPALGIKIQYPTDWEQKKAQTNGNITFISPLKSNLDTYRDNVIITTNRLLKNTTLDAYADTFINELKKNSTDFKIVEENLITLTGNTTAYKIVFTTKDGQHDLKAMVVLAIKNDKVYIIEYNSEVKAYSNYLATVEKMIDSFNIEMGSFTGSFFGLVMPAPLLGIPSPVLPPLGAAPVPLSPPSISPLEDNETIIL